MSEFAPKYKNIAPKELKTMMYPIAPIKTQFGKKNIIYADFIASGRPSPLIENFIVKNIYSKYSNTHSNSTNGICMKNEIEKVRDLIKREFSVDDGYEILFKGSGSTDCVNFLLDCLDYTQYKKIHIFISTYEHYSNHLPFVELARAEIHVIPLTTQNELDLDWFSREISRIYAGAARGGGGGGARQLIITSITHCSNLTGYFTPLTKIKKILDSHNHKNIQKYFFTDVACSAPYAKINGGMFDALFLSAHKFIGGVGCPGVLIARTCLFHKKSPVNPGGSCVKSTHQNTVKYADNIEVRESAGTPAIVGIIKFGQCLLLKQHYSAIIKHNEDILTELIQRYTCAARAAYPQRFFAIPYGGGRGAAAAAQPHRLPIFAFSVAGLHYNFIVVLLNDMFGIQTRGGKSCDGLFMDYIKSKYGVEGFCRISFHWTMTRKQIKYIFDCVDFVLEHGHEYLDYYKYNPAENLYVAATAEGRRCAAALK